MPSHDEHSIPKLFVVVVVVVMDVEVLVVVAVVVVVVVVVVIVIVVLVPDALKAGPSIHVMLGVGEPLGTRPTDTEGLEKLPAQGPPKFCKSPR